MSSPSSNISMELTLWTPREAGGGRVMSSSKYIKVAVDGAPYLRKINLHMYTGYHHLITYLEQIFFPDGIIFDNTSNQRKLTDLTNGEEYVLTYQDNDDDWMQMGDLPWKMFVDSCKSIRLMKST